MIDLDDTDRALLRELVIDGTLSAGELGRRLGLSQPAAWRRVRRLEEAGLVRREASPEDGRGVLASITDQGREVVEVAMVTYSEAVRERFLGPLTRPQMSALGENCRRLSEAAKTERSNGKARRT